MGPRRSGPGPAHRGDRRPPRLEHQHPPQGRRLPNREDLRRLEEPTSSIPAPTQAALRTLEWIGNHENLVICGPSGTGKTHFLEKRSIALSSNLHPAGFDELMPKIIANATVDRLLHHAHLVAATGDSIRLTQATHGKGVRPLTR